MYKYVKAPPGHTLHRPLTVRQKLRLGLSALFLTLGIAAFTSVAYPMFVYWQTYAPTYDAAPPVPTVHASEPVFVKEMINTTFDYTDSSTWFPQATTTLPNSSVSVSSDLVYTLSIDKLGIKDALVRSDHTDLKKTLIHYPGTAMPGDLGNTVILATRSSHSFLTPKTTPRSSPLSIPSKKVTKLSSRRVGQPILIA